MKITKIIAIASVAVMMASCGTKPAEGSKEVQALLPAKSSVDSVSYLIGVQFGSWIKGNNFGDLNYNEIVKGIKAWMDAKGTPQDSTFFSQFKVNPEEMNEILDSYVSKRRDYTAALNKEKGDKFLEENKAKEGWEVTESGLQYKIIEPGNDNHPADQDTVWVNYKGTLINGDVFDQNDDIRFTLNRVVKGWQEGMKLIGEGGKIQLAIPSDLGYGTYGNRGIEPNSVLLFDVTLNKIGKFVAPAEEPKAE